MAAAGGRHARTGYEMSIHRREDEMNLAEVACAVNQTLKVAKE